MPTPLYTYVLNIYDVVYLGGLHNAKSPPLSVSLSLYIYIYIYCHPQTDCFVLSELFGVARHAGRLKPGSIPVHFYARLSFRPFGHQADHFGQGNFKVFILAKQQQPFLHFYTQSATRVLNFFEELCITLAAAEIPSPECSTPMGERIYCHPQTDYFVPSI